MTGLYRMILASLLLARRWSSPARPPARAEARDAER